MVFYFSATGNSRHVAQRLAAATGDQCADIAALAHGDTHIATLAAGERLGFVFPVYFWGLPTLVEDFLRKLTVRKEKAEAATYVYGVVTYGTSIGGAYAELRRALRNRGIGLDARFCVRMPDSWTPMFDLSDKEETLRKCRQAEPRIDAIARLVAGNWHGTQRSWTRLPLALSRLYHLTYASARRTSHFRVLPEKCTHCGRCARRCPAGAITMRDGFPRWEKPQCAACLGCLHRCPAFAIQYGRHTECHGQYRHPEDAAPEIRQ